MTPLALGSAMASPFEMDTIVGLCSGRKVATHYGLYSTITGTGIVAGNIAIGILLGATDTALPWLTMSGIGAASALAVFALHHAGQLNAATPAAVLTSRRGSPQPDPAANDLRYRGRQRAKCQQRTADQQAAATVARCGGCAANGGGSNAGVVLKGLVLLTG